MASGYPVGSNTTYYDPNPALPPAKPAKSSLPRSISQADLAITARCRNHISSDWVGSAPDGGTNFFATTPYFTLMLPPLDQYPPDFQEFAYAQIINRDTQGSLEDDRCLNWCTGTTNLVPLYTLGDGNCLLHAASLAMWGFSDRDYILRKAVSHALLNCHNNTLSERWKKTRENDNLRLGYHLDPHQWTAEWEEVVRQASAEAAPGKSLDGLEEFHVFVLANILRRPIIMYAAPKLLLLEGLTLQRVEFYGIYLPLLWDKSACKKYPLPIAYHFGHFSALAVIEYPGQFHNGHLVFPLDDYYGQHLPIRFMLPQEDATALMMDYLDLIQVSSQTLEYSRNVLCAKFTVQETPAYLKPLIKGFFDACFQSEAYTSHRSSQVQSSMKQTSREPCINECGMWGDSETGLCSKCYRDKQVQSTAAVRQHPASRHLPPYPAPQSRKLYGTIVLACPLCRSGLAINACPHARGK